MQNHRLVPLAGGQWLNYYEFLHDRAFYQDSLRPYPGLFAQYRDSPTLSYMDVPIPLADDDGYGHPLDMGFVLPPGDPRGIHYTWPTFDRVLRQLQYPRSHLFMYLRPPFIHFNLHGMAPLTPGSFLPPRRRGAAAAPLAYLGTRPPQLLVDFLQTGAPGFAFATAAAADPEIVYGDHRRLVVENQEFRQTGGNTPMPPPPLTVEEVWINRATTIDPTISAYFSHGYLLHHHPTIRPGALTYRTMEHYQQRFDFIISTPSRDRPHTDDDIINVAAGGVCAALLKLYSYGSRGDWRDYLREVEGAGGFLGVAEALRFTAIRLTMSFKHPDHHEVKSSPVIHLTQPGADLAALNARLSPDADTWSLYELAQVAHAYLLLLTTSAVYYGHDMPGAEHGSRGLKVDNWFLHLDTLHRLFTKIIETTFQTAPFLPQHFPLDTARDMFARYDLNDDELREGLSLIQLQIYFTRPGGIHETIETPARFYNPRADFMQQDYLSRRGLLNV